MASQESVTDVANVLLRRAEMIGSLRTGPKSRGELVESLGRSGSTVDRATRELAAAGMIRSVDGRFETTTPGELAVEGLFALVETVEVTREFEEFVRCFPVREAELDVRAFGDAALLTPDSGGLDSLLEWHVDLLHRINRGRFLLPSSGPGAGRAVQRAILESGVHGRLVTTAGVASAFDSTETADGLEDLRAAGGCELYVTDELPYTLVIGDETVWIVAEESGEPRAVVDTSTAEIRRWATDAFERHRATARRAI